MPADQGECDSAPKRSLGSRLRLRSPLVASTTSGPDGGSYAHPLRSSGWRIEGAGGGWTLLAAGRWGAAAGRSAATACAPGTTPAGSASTLSSAAAAAGSVLLRKRPPCHQPWSCSPQCRRAVRRPCRPECVERRSAPASSAQPCAHCRGEFVPARSNARFRSGRCRVCCPPPIGTNAITVTAAEGEGAGASQRAQERRNGLRGSSGGRATVLRARWGPSVQPPPRSGGVRQPPNGNPAGHSAAARGHGAHASAVTAHRTPHPLRTQLRGR